MALTLFLAVAMAVAMSATLSFVLPLFFLYNPTIYYYFMAVSVGRKISNKRVASLIYPEWGQQPKESTELYEQFKLYLEMKPRSYRELAKKIEPDSYTAQMRLLSSIKSRSVNWMWQKRAELFDQECDRVMFDGMKREARQMGKRLAVRARKSELALFKPIEELIRRFRDNPDALSEEMIDTPRLIRLVHSSITLLMQLGEFEQRLFQSRFNDFANDPQLDQLGGGSSNSTQINIQINGSRSKMLDEMSDMIDNLPEVQDAGFTGIADISGK